MQTKIAAGWRTAILSAALLAATSAVVRAQDDAPPASDANAAGIQAMQQRLLSDPQTAAAVQALQSDPDVQAVLNDPAISAALARGDFTAVMADPKIRRLADNPTVQSLTRQVGP